MAMAMSGQAIAQEATAPSDELGEVVVTAQRRSENLQRAAIAVSAVNAETLQQRGVSEAQDLTKLVPALKITGAAGGGTQVTIRGVGSFSGNAFAEPGVALNYDGVYLARSAGTNGLFFDLERVEVVKGPQGTLYGRNATAGAVNLVTRKPGSEFGGEAGVEIGNYDRIRAYGAVNLPLSDWAALRISGQTARRDGYLSDGYNDEDSDAVRALLKLDPSEDLSILLSADYSRAGGMGSAGVFTPFVDPSDPYLGPSSPASNLILSRTGLPLPPLRDDGFVDQSSWGVSAQVDYQMDWATLTVVPAYRSMDLSYLHYGAGYPLTESQTPEQTSVETRLASSSDGPLKWLIGLYYFDEQTNTRIFPNQGVTYNRSAIPDIQTTSKAAFGQLTWSLTDTFRLTGGLRYTSEDKSVNGFVTGPLPAVPAGFPAPAPVFYAIACPSPSTINLAALQCTSPVTGAVTFEKATWKIGAELDLTDRSLLYATVGTGFKAGGFYPSLAPNTFEPELLTAFTIGSKNRFLDNTLRLNAEAFYWNYEDKQVTHLGPVRPSGYNLITENAGKAVIYGLDVEATWLATPNDLFSAQVQVQESNYDSFIYSLTSPSGRPPATGCAFRPTGVDPVGSSIFSVDCSGRQLALAPQWVANFTYNHTFALNDGAELVAGLSTRVESSYYTGEEYLPGQLQDAAMVSNADLTYRPSSLGWSVTAFVQNIEDEAVMQSSFV